MNASSHFPRSALMAVALLGAAVLIWNCGPVQASFGESCSVYASPADCKSGLQCECLEAGCFCTTPCPQTGSCQTGHCFAGHNPSLGTSGYYCFGLQADGGR